MATVKELKSENLKKFLLEYPSFVSFPEEEKSAYLKKLVNLSLEEQEKVYEFLDTENQKEKLSTLMKFSDSLTELANKLNSLRIVEKEKASERKEKEEIEDILDQIN